MRRVVVYDVPAGSEVGVVTFHKEGRIVAPLTAIEGEESDMRQRVGSSLPRNPSSVQESQKCLLCGLQEAVKVLDTGTRKSEGATVILITTGSSQAPKAEVRDMVRLATQWNLRVEVVLYPLTERRGAPALSHGLGPLLEATGGSLFTVVDEGVGNDSKVKMLVALMDALLAAVQNGAPNTASGGPVLIHSAEYPGGIATVSTGIFALDDSLSPNARFSIYYYDLNHVGNAIDLRAPSGHMISAVNVQEEDGDVNMIFINLEMAEVGLGRVYSARMVCASKHFVSCIFKQIHAKLHHTPYSFLLDDNVSNKSCYGCGREGSGGSGWRTEPIPTRVYTSRSPPVATRPRGCRFASGPPPPPTPSPPPVPRSSSTPRCV